MKIISSLLSNNFFLYTLLCFFPFFVDAQIADHVYKTDHRINPEKKGQLLVEVDNLSFFKNNEFDGTIVKGYSLPGLWLQSKIVYYPLSNIKLEAGMHMLWYHGAHKYPNSTYVGIPQWQADHYQSGAHFLPFFRGQVALSDHWDIIFGNIYGGSNHNLIEPLYAPELNLTADPEMGLQVLYNSALLDLDAWVNWQSFIFQNDTHQEIFTVGLSSRLKMNDPESEFHFYMPLQGLIQHRGGEIDTITTQSVQTLMNGALGIGGVWNVNRKVLKNINVELDAAGYYQQSGELWPLDKGYGLYARASADISDFRVKTSYWQCDKFISMFGLPFYGALSSKHEGATYKRPKMVYFGLEYSRSFAKGYSLGIDLDVYHNLSGTMQDPLEGKRSISSSTAFSFGAYLRINPSVLLKSF